MRFSVSRDALMRPLNLVAGVVERRQTLPILSNLLLNLEGNSLSLTGTDLEVELVGRVTVESSGADGNTSVPARKLVDICKSLPDDAQIEFSLEAGKATVKTGKSRFTLSTLAATDFPTIESSMGGTEISLQQSLLKEMIDKTSFAMAQQDVRYYLNGMLLELLSGQMRLVATDGHRLALCTAPGLITSNDTSIIIPRKGVLELTRLLDGDETVDLAISGSHIRAANKQFSFISKLIDGKFPDYERVLPKSPDKAVIGDRLSLRQAFVRTAILSNEKYRGVRLSLNEGSLEITASNPEQEQAEEEVLVDYQGEPIEVGFNVSYLLDVLGVLTGDDVRLSLSDSASSALIEKSGGVLEGEPEALYVVMPMRL